MQSPFISDNPDKSESPWLVIPYWPGDRGVKTIERPLAPSPNKGTAVPPSVIPWLCDSIQVIGGSPGVDFIPGSPTTVAVTVRNYGKGAGLDLVYFNLWWSPPSTEFGALTKKPVMAQAIDTIQRGGPPLVTHMTFTPPVSAGPHICVVVRVTAGNPIVPGDPSFDGTPVWPSDPIGDRHWAQRNLQYVTANSDGHFHITFMSGNTTSRELPFLIRGQEVSGQVLEKLAREVRAIPRNLSGASIEISPLIVHRKQEQLSKALSGDQAETTVIIGSNSQLTMVLKGQLKQPLGPGEFTAFEVIQTVSGKAREFIESRYAEGSFDDSVTGRTGSIGIIVSGPVST